MENIEGYMVSGHAEHRMRTRNVPSDAISAALRYGRCLHSRGAIVHFLGKKEVRSNRDQGIDISKAEGTTVLISSDSPVIVTVFRSPNLRKHRAASIRKASHGPSIQVADTWPRIFEISPQKRTQEFYRLETSVRIEVPAVKEIPAHVSVSDTRALHT